MLDQEKSTAVLKISPITKVSPRSLKITLIWIKTPTDILKNLPEIKKFTWSFGKGGADFKKKSISILKRANDHGQGKSPQPKKQNPHFLSRDPSIHFQYKGFRLLLVIFKNT